MAGHAGSRIAVQHRDSMSAWATGNVVAIQGHGLAGSLKACDCVQVRRAHSVIAMWPLSYQKNKIGAKYTENIEYL